MTVFAPFGASTTIEVTQSTQAVALPTMPSGSPAVALVSRQSSLGNCYVRFGDATVTVSADTGMRVSPGVPEAPYILGISGAETYIAILCEGTSGKVSLTAGALPESSGNVIGPTTSTDNAIARYDGTAGVLQNSGALLSDTDALTNLTGLAIGSASATYKVTVVDDRPSWTTGTLYDTARFVIGGFEFANEFGGDLVRASHALVGAVKIPSSATGANHSTGTAGFSYTLSASHGAVGVYGQAGIGIDGTSAVALNSVITNGINQVVADLGGFQGFFLAGHECDINIKTIASGAAPTGNAYGVFINSGSSCQPTGEFDAYHVEIGLTTPFKRAFRSNAGAATIGVSLGAVSTASGSNSQTFQLSGINGGGTTLTGTMYVDSGGNFITLPGTGGIVALLDPSSNTIATVESTLISLRKPVDYWGSSSGQTKVQATAAASGTLTLPAATDTLIGKATTDTLTNKTYNTAGTGNSFSINGVAATANTGTGAVVRAATPSVSDLTVTGSFTATGLVANAALVNMADTTIKGRAVGAGTGVPTDLTAAQAAAIVGSVGGALKSKLIVITRDLTAATGSVGYTGVGFVPTSMIVTGSVALVATGTYTTYAGMSDSARTSGALVGDAGTVLPRSNEFAAFYDTAGTSNQTATVSSYDADGFTLSWTKTGTPTGTVTMFVMCFR